MSDYTQAELDAIDDNIEDLAKYLNDWSWPKVDPIESVGPDPGPAKLVMKYTDYAAAANESIRLRDFLTGRGIDFGPSSDNSILCTFDPNESPWARLILTGVVSQDIASSLSQ